MGKRGHEPRKWCDCFPLITNGQLISLCRAGFTAVQLEIVLYLLTRTLGTGRLMSASSDELPDGWEEWQAAKETYGRETAALYRSTIGQGIHRHDKLVARELRRLIAAGVVVEHEAGHKGKRAVLSVDLDRAHWRPSHLHGGARTYPRAARGPVDNLRGQSGNGNSAVPDNGNSAVPESGGNGNSAVPLFKRPKDDTLRACSHEHNTANPQAASPIRSPEEIQTPEIRELALLLSEGE